MLATLGTTARCSPSHSLAQDIWVRLCKQRASIYHADCWSFLACPEFRYLSKGVEFKDGVTAAKYFTIGKEVQKNGVRTSPPCIASTGVCLPAGRRANAIKIYFVLRSLGYGHIQKELRKAALFARLVTDDDDFELFVPQHLGLVCFRIKNGTNAENRALCRAINDDRRIHLVPGEVHGVYFLRFAVCSPLTNEDDIKFAFNICKELLANLNLNNTLPQNKSN
ncbi:hypothetical protein COOONC_23099 [Cooperia oncophora]